MNEVALKRVHLRAPVDGGSVKIRADKPLAPGEEADFFETDFAPGELAQLLERGVLELVDEPEVPALALRPALELHAEKIELDERLARSREDLAIAIAAVTDADNTLRPLVVRVRRGDKEATKDRDAEERRLDAAQRAQRDAQYVFDADVADLQSRIDELDAAIAIAEEREKRERDEAEAAAKMSRYLKSLAGIDRALVAVQPVFEEHLAAAHAVGSHVMAFPRLFDPVGMAIFYGYPHTRTALEVEARTDSDLAVLLDLTEAAER